VSQDGQPTVAELAEQITALKAAHTVEATPERTAKRKIAAEEPVTARIRRKAECHPFPDQGMKLLADEPAALPTGQPRSQTPADASLNAAPTTPTLSIDSPPDGTDRVICTQRATRSR
jgi:hypothetical protein